MEKWRQSPQFRANHLPIKHAIYLLGKADGKALLLTKQPMTLVTREVRKCPLGYTQESICDVHMPVEKHTFISSAYISYSIYGHIVINSGER